MSLQREKAWRMAEGLLRAAAPESVSYGVLEAVLGDVGFDDPYEVVNDWSKDGRLVLVNGEHRLRSRRYTLSGTAPRST